MRNTRTSLAAISLLVLFTLGADAPKSYVNVDRKGLALQGYDPVAYFTDNKPVKGDASITAMHEGATYRFASNEHRDLFQKEPSKYAPQFGGYCAYAVSLNKTASIEVEQFSIVDGRLLLQNSARATRLWNKDVGGNLKKADSNWPGLVAENGKP